MSINLASKYSEKVAERYSAKSLTDGWAGKNYDFSGVKTIKIYSVNTVNLGDYRISQANNRYGTIQELGDTVDELSITQDKAFTFSIDAGNNESQFNVKQATQCLKREIDEVVTPAIDKWRLEKWAESAGISQTDASLTKSNIVDAIFTLSASMSDERVPYNDRVIFIPELMFVKFQLSDVVMGKDTMGAGVVRNGYRGTIDGMSVVTVPASIFPTNTNFIIKQRSATVDPVKLKNYRVHKSPVGIDGDVVEGRIMYDAFVLASRAKGVARSVVSQ